MGGRNDRTVQTHLQVCVYIIPIIMHIDGNIFALFHELWYIQMGIVPQ